MSSSEAVGVLESDSLRAALEFPVVVIGAGACGLIAGMAAGEADLPVLIVERDSVPHGSTGLSSGMIPAAGTLVQRRRGIEDSPSLLLADILAKNGGDCDRRLAEAVAVASGPTVDWLTETRGVQLELVDGFLYPGTSRLRMHAPLGMTGLALMASLRRAAESSGVEILADARASTLFATPEGYISGVRVERPDGSTEEIGCQALILACNGYGGDPELVARHLPDMKDALYFGHPGNRGEALRWGRVLGASTRHLGSYQGHGSVAHPHSILITWALMMEGGIQVNSEGRRFSNEHLGYSEQARLVLAQPGGLAWNIYDRRLHELGLGFEDYRRAVDCGAIHRADDPAALAARLGLPDALADTLDQVQRLAREGGADAHGRSFDGKPPLASPYYGVRVTGALFHTQGGLVTDTEGRVLREDGGAFPNLFAGGGAACGISGPEDWGYLSGNGLLTATTLGYLSGRAAARCLDR